MGKFNWRRALRAVGTGGASELARGAGIDFNPGPNGNDPDYSQLYEHRANLPLDPATGMPIGGVGPPAHELALNYQYRAQDWARQRQNALWGDAQGSISQGIDLLQSYRPGGSAALASGMFGQRANLYAGQAASIQEPDLMSAYREDKEIQAEREAKRAARFQQIMGVVQTAAGIAGMAAGAPPVGGSLLGSPQGQAFAQQGGPPMGTPGPGGTTMMGPGYGYPGSNALGPQYGTPGVGGYSSQGPYAPAMSGGGGGGMPAPVHGGGARAPQGGGPQGGGPQGGGGTAMAQAGPSGAVAGGDGNFTGQAVAAARMNSPIGQLVEPMMVEEMADDPQQLSFTNLVVMSARSRLHAASMVG